MYLGIYGGGGTYPLDSAIPKGLEGLLIAGKAVSISRMAMGRSRFQGSLIGQGRNLGAVAAHAALEGQPLREVNVWKVLRKSGRKPGPWQPPGAEEVAKAVKNLEIESHRAIVAFSPEVSIPLLKREFAANPTFDGALVLCTLRQKEGAGLLIEWLDKQSLKKGRPYTGPLQEFIKFVGPPAKPQEKPEADPARLGFTGSPRKVVKVFHPEARRGGEIIAGEPAEAAARLAEKLRALGVC